MTREAGLWIDHRKAVIVTVNGDDVETKEMLSNMEVNVRFSSGSSDSGFSEDGRDRQMDNYLDSFYDEVIATIGGVEAVLIMGPGEAKGELVKRLERSPVAGRIVILETVDKLTDRQIAEKVREQFHILAERR